LTPAGLAELFRAPALADHYQEHWAETCGAITWGDFLIMHYTDTDHEDQDGRRHGHLPFHGRSTAGGVFLLSAAPLVVPCVVNLPEIRAQMTMRSCGNWPGRSVFHPPKAIG